MVPRPAALPLGILMVGLGSVLLFVAFHNLPESVGTFPAFLGYLSGNLATGPVTYATGKIPAGGGQ